LIELRPESLEELRKRLREMSNLELRRFGERARKLSLRGAGWEWPKDWRSVGSRSSASLGRLPNHYGRAIVLVRDFTVSENQKRSSGRGPVSDAGSTAKSLCPGALFRTCLR